MGDTSLNGALHPVLLAALPLFVPPSPGSFALPSSLLVFFLSLPNDVNMCAPQESLLCCVPHQWPTSHGDNDQGQKL